jgi:hypothetical protein
MQFRVPPVLGLCETRPSTDSSLVKLAGEAFTRTLPGTWPRLR